MPNYAQMILDLRSAGLSAADIVRWAKKRGHTFSEHALSSIVRRGSVPRETIRKVLEDLHPRICT